jgi:hypothetical protein
LPLSPAILAVRLTLTDAELHVLGCQILRVRASRCSKMHFEMPADAMLLGARENALAVAKVR